MPVFRPVETLQDLCIQTCATWFVRCSTTWPDVQAKKYQKAHIYQYLNAFCRQEFINKILQRHMHEFSVDNKIIILELLGDQQMSSFDVVPSGYQYIEEVFAIYRALTYSLMVNIKRLGISCKLKSRGERQVIGDVNTFFGNTLNKMRHLTSITLHGLGDANLLTIIGKTCKGLQHLDVSHSSRVNDTSLSNLFLSNAESLNTLLQGDLPFFVARLNPCCETLKYLGLAATSIGTQSVLTSVLLAPKLETFGGYLDYGRMAYGIALPFKKSNSDTTDNSSDSEETIMDLHDLERNGIFKITNANYEYEDKDLETIANSADTKLPLPSTLKFSEIWDVLPPSDIVDILRQVCPCVTSFHTSAKALPQLVRFRPLKSLEIECDFREGWDEFVLNYIYECGSSLESITVNEPDNAFLSLSEITKYCPKLKKLTMPVYVEEDVQLTVNYANISVMSWHVLDKLCCHNSSLKELYIVLNEQIDCESLTDERLGKALAGVTLHHLEVLIVGKCKLSNKAFQILWEHCPTLRVVGFVDMWQNMSMSELACVIEEIKSNNWDVSLVRSLNSSGYRSPYLKVRC